MPHVNRLIDVDPFRQGFHPDRHNSRPFRDRKYIPVFSANDAQLQLAIRFQCWKYARVGGVRKRRILRQKSWTRFQTMSLADLRRECRKATSRLGVHRQLKLREHKRDLRRAGDYPTQVSIVCWLSWRCGWRSPQISGEVGISPVKVRAILNRVVQGARFLGFETFKAHHTFGRRRDSWQTQCHLQW